MYPWGEGPILSKLASDSCGAGDSEGPWKGSRRKVGWKGVVISPLHLDFRPGRGPNRDGQEGIEGGSRDWTSAFLSRGRTLA